MSRGMQQKVAIARALLTSPTLLLLDEPTTGLDPRSKLDVQAFVEEVNAEHDATIVLTTHDLAEAERLCEPHHDPRRGSRGRRGHARRAQAPRRRAPRAAEPTLEAVFMTFTGRSLDEDVEEDGRHRRLNHRKEVPTMTNPADRPRRHHSPPSERTPTMQHIEYRLADDRGAPGAATGRSRERDRAGHGPPRSFRRRLGESLIRLGRAASAVTTR